MPIPYMGEGGGIEIIRDAHSLYLPGDILRFPLLAKCGLQDTIQDFQKVKTSGPLNVEVIEKTLFTIHHRGYHKNKVKGTFNLKILL